MSLYDEAEAGRRAPTDRVDQILDEVRRDIAERQAAGDLPRLPPEELQQQFDAIVEVTSADLETDDPELLDTVSALSALPSWSPKATSPLRWLIYAVTAPLRRIISRLVRNQLSPFTTQTAALLRELSGRQQKQGRFLRDAHLDRLRSLEARVADLELDSTTAKKTGPERPHRRSLV